MKHTIMMISLTIVAVVALFVIIGNTATGEEGWPQNEDDDPENGGNWMGNGSMDLPGGPGGDPPAQHADWYNTTHSNTDWIINGTDDILRSHSAFDFKHDLIIEDGGILRLDSVHFFVNTTQADHKIWIKLGGALYITNSTINAMEILAEGELHILPGSNETSFSFVDIIGEDAKGISIKPGSEVEIVNSSISGEVTPITVEDAGAVIHGNELTTFSTNDACIHLKAAADIYDNSFSDGTSEGSYAIIADEGVNSKIYNNTFMGFRFGLGIHGRAILSYGPIELYGNLFTGMESDIESDPYFIYFVGVEPTDHDGEPVWETNRFRGIKSASNQHRVNIFKQAWYVDVTVKNNFTGHTIEDAKVEIKNKNGFVVGSDNTDAAGKAYFEIPEIYVTALNDGDNGDSLKEPRDNNNFIIYAEATMQGQTDNTTLENQTIRMDKGFEVKLDLVEFDYSVSNLGYPGVITAGRTVGLVATVYNYGYNRETSITIEFYINDEKLGEVVDFLMNLDYKDAHFNAMIPMAYANQDVVLKARTVFAQDHNNSNDEWVTGAVHVNKQPSVTITSPIEGGTVSDEVNITGTELDEDGTVDQVMVNITGGLDWTDAQITESWYYNFNTHSLANGDYELKAIAIDNNGAISDIFLINITVANKPTVSITSPADGDDVYGNTTVTMLGATQMLDTAITRVTVSIDDGEEINATETKPGWSQWSFDLKKGVKDRLNSLSDGPHTFTAKVYDAAGLSNSVTVTYIVHSMDASTNPAITFTTDPFEITHDTIIEGTATDDYRVTGMQYSINAGDWVDIDPGELTGIGTSSVTWMVHVNPGMFEEGNNIFEVKAFDDDANSTATLTVYKPEFTGVDLSISGAELKNDKGGTLKKANVGNTIKVKVQVHKTGPGKLPQVPIRVEIGGIFAASYTEENVSGDFEHTFSIKLTESMKGKNTYSVMVDPANIVNEDNETNNIQEGNLPKIGGPKKDDENGGFLRGFEIAVVIAGIAVAGLIALSRKRRD